MKPFAVLIVSLMVFGLLLLVGCSKDDDVAELEKEMMEQQESEGEMTADTAAPPEPSTPSEDTMTPEQTRQQPDAGAIPEEQQEHMDMPERPAGSGYEVQVAGCEDPEYARYLVDKYRQRGYEPYVTEATIDGQKYYRVRLGVFQGYSEAKQVRMEVEDRYSIEAWIDPIP